MIDNNEVLPRARSAYPDGTGGPKKMAPAKKPTSAAAGVQGKSNGLYPKRAPSYLMRGAFRCHQVGEGGNQLVPKRAPSYGDPNALGDCAAAVLGL